ncbi:non-homologous end-joining DNA ligase [Pseudokineococcus lusitanus]|uniref:Bifunctional non-homologous end joining protein LigD n=1 Tax=Pseudokineococcus lusitanus TaxID=763993 RepID=A0A3N1HKF2_9ACTN|nr:non-homologous end-joining DNA ligase [Pseudokineococcus lusitanus]ROP42931.1 bifunctional non-homologous end joining protein LigD [Pseudokineococcus lusitanus]
MSPHQATEQVVEVGGHRLRLTSLEKVLYPATGTTKAEVLDYVVRAAEPLLRQLAGRPVTRVRWPHGVADTSFFEKNAPPGTPSWVRTAAVPLRSGERDGADDGDEGVETVRYPLLDDVAGLAWVTNLSAIELHTPQWRVCDGGAPGGRGRPARTAHPDRLVVDLDPGPGTGLAECAALAHVVADRLLEDGLDPRPVTSGSKGLQLYAAVSGEQDADVVRAYVRRLAEDLARDRPREVVATMTKARRTGRVLLDWSQNTWSKTTVTPYSLRGREQPRVAAPRLWDELDDDLQQLSPQEVLDRLDADGDLLDDVTGPGPRLPEP